MRRPSTSRSKSWCTWPNSTARTAGKRLQQRHELVAVGEAHRIQPAAVHGHRMMVQAHQHMPLAAHAPAPVPARPARRGRSGRRFRPARSCRAGSRASCRRPRCRRAGRAVPTAARAWRARCRGCRARTAPAGPARRVQCGNAHSRPDRPAPGRRWRAGHRLPRCVRAPPPAPRAAPAAWARRAVRAPGRRTDAGSVRWTSLRAGLAIGGD